MLISIAGLLICLGIILLSCELFTNAIEWVGVRLNVGSGVVGSILSGVGTALPETMVPIIAILFTSGNASHEVGIGAIAGAPFMLGTLTLFIAGFSIAVYSFFGKRTKIVQADLRVIRRDLSTFLAVYSLAVFTGFIPSLWFHRLVGFILIAAYGFYIYRTINADQETNTDVEPLYFSRWLNLSTTPIVLISLQVLLALVGIMGGAKFFVTNLTSLAELTHLSPLILSMILTPIATELPEKMNSVIWTGRGKDTLALGNITGAMVFQSCFPVGVGILFTPWILEGVTLISALLVLTSITLLYITILLRKRITINNLMFSGGFYLLFIIYLLRWK